MTEYTRLRPAQRTNLPPHAATLRNERVRRGLTQVELDDLIGFSHGTVRRLEAGHTPVLPRMALRWAAALGHTIDAVPTDHTQTQTQEDACSPLITAA